MARHIFFHFWLDTPGHVILTYEVSRSPLLRLWGCYLGSRCCTRDWGQTLANVYLALDNDLEIPFQLSIRLICSQQIRSACTEIEDVIGLDASEAVYWLQSAGIGIEENSRANCSKKSLLQQETYQQRFDSTGIRLSWSYPPGVRVGWMELSSPG